MTNKGITDIKKMIAEMEARKPDPRIEAMIPKPSKIIEKPIAPALSPKKVNKPRRRVSE